MRLFTAAPALLFLASLVTAAKQSDGLNIEFTRNTTCTRKSRAGDTISVHYRGSLKSDGSVFDESYKRGEPFQFTLGEGYVIAGWDLGLQDMCIGDARKLIIPPELGYGEFGSGPIPPKATLIFDTELMGIDGVKPDSHPPKPDLEVPPPPPPSADEAKHGDGNGPKDGHANNDSECRLLGPFALVVQAALGGLALLALVFKRWRETPRRPLKIWFFDVSKQVVGSGLLHLANLFMSMLSSGRFSVTAEDKLKAGFSHKEEDMPNPCSFYLLNLAIDTTLGIPILVLLLRVLHALFLHTPIANPPESIKSGHYGTPPRANWWLKQSFIYFIGLFGMKFCVFVIFQLLPWIAWVGDWALRWTEGNEALQITFVMFIFPVCMNAVQYYIIDSFIKDPAGGSGHGPIPSGEPSAEDEERQRLRRGSLDEDEDDEDFTPGGNNIDTRAKSSGHGALKEANPLPMPEYDPEVDGASSSSPRSSKSGAEVKETVRR
ncbi:uncharacterized protein K452DRAFT_217792 [Aplosporella prunicola CBS 121167]|uniref:peptidylprolyl isomerase n=1 Tax=Aplosporella prunicola CBS 121167 TaxID=1176127 RepID=A0A6A6BSM8_9PEZI|nr:uncharacterized protein K452DRAFT_217792 [Aplosporella prunicola CBS 121167]KAF2147096.1 hypothetical protein K452DRAFT_217792 [Aplosporella prunicola CBS 121167]